MAGGAGMVSVTAAAARAQKLVERDKREWAANGGAEALFDVVLHPPNERTVLADQAEAIAWVRAWRGIADGDADVHWSRRQWASVGAQEVPERLVIKGADAIALFAGPTASRGWEILRDRAAVVWARFGGASAGGFALPAEPAGLADAIRRHARSLEVLPEADFVVLLDVVDWLAQHPSSGFRIRQLPIRGIDTKWLERHRAVVEGFHSAVTGLESLGLLAPAPLVRLRFLDPELRPGGLLDVTAPVDELALLDLSPDVVFVFENLESVLAMPPMAGAVVVHGSGYAVGRLARIPWVRSGRVVYWGDLDSDGFAILHALRSGCDDVTSVLMDEATLVAHRDLWVPERKAAAGAFATLTPAELRALQRIRSEGNVRLEQERIPWAIALAALSTRLSQGARG